MCSKVRETELPIQVSQPQSVLQPSWPRSWKTIRLCYNCPAWQISQFAPDRGIKSCDWSISHNLKAPNHSVTDQCHKSSFTGQFGSTNDLIGFTKILIFPNSPTIWLDLPIILIIVSFGNLIGFAKLLIIGFTKLCCTLSTHFVDNSKRNYVERA